MEQHKIIASSESYPGLTLIETMLTDGSKAYAVGIIGSRHTVEVIEATSRQGAEAIYDAIEEHGV
jgi:hypothetical protein